MIRVAVKYRPEATPEAIAALEARHALAAVRRIAPLRVRVYELAAEARDALAREPLVELVEEDQEMRGL